MKVPIKILFSPTDNPITAGRNREREWIVGFTMLVGRNATAAERSINFGGVLLLIWNKDTDP